MGGFGIPGRPSLPRGAPEMHREPEGAPDNPGPPATPPPNPRVPTPECQTAPRPLSPHSYLKAMIGSRRDARRAGQIPKKTPTRIEKPMARNIAVGATAVFQFWKCFSA